ncbi:RusA family crossover junction endodeoxyribonuclease [Microcystis phage MinS1]|nr:RusA family crossover junction endodeoxyribonuclease [Microcystis phage MinS1]
MTEQLFRAERISLRVTGTPIPQGSKVANRHGGGVRDANATRLKPWRQQVTAHAREHARGLAPYTGPVRIWIRFTFERPLAHYRTGRNAHLLKPTAPTWPTSRYVGDVDKLQRAIFDALTDADLWTDDSQVVDVRARKFYAGEHELAMPTAGVEIILEETT